MYARLPTSCSSSATTTDCTPRFVTDSTPNGKRFNSDGCPRNAASSKTSNKRTYSEMNQLNDKEPTQRIQHNDNHEPQTEQPRDVEIIDHSNLRQSRRQKSPNAAKKRKVSATQILNLVSDDDADDDVNTHETKTTEEEGEEDETDSSTVDEDEDAPCGSPGSSLLADLTKLTTKKTISKLMPSGSTNHNGKANDHTNNSSNDSHESSSVEPVAPPYEHTNDSTSRQQSKEDASSKQENTDSEQSDMDLSTAFAANQNDNESNTDSSSSSAMDSDSNDDDDDDDDDDVVVLSVTKKPKKGKGDEPTGKEQEEEEETDSDLNYDNELKFEYRNPMNCRHLFYQHMDKRVSRLLLNTQLTQQMKQDIDSTRPNKFELKLKRYLIEFVVHQTGVLMKNKRMWANRKIINDDYSRFVHLYGSVPLNIDSSACDVDIAIEIPSHYSSTTFLRNLANLLERHRVQQNKKFRVERVLKAKVPILKLTDPLYHIEADIAIYKSHDMSVKYIESLISYNKDERIRQLVIAIKHWSKRRNINCAMTGKINSFGFTLLVLKYCQFLKCPLVPTMDYQHIHLTDSQQAKIMQSEAYKQKCEENALYKYYTSSHQYHSLRVFERDTEKKKKKCNQMTLSELLFGFFEFYSNFDMNRYQISLNSKYLLNKQIAEFIDYGFKMDQLTFIIQDPIETTNNCAKNVRHDTAQLILNEFKRAYAILLYGGDWNDVCCSTQQQPNVYDTLTLKHEIYSYQQSQHQEKQHKNDNKEENEKLVALHKSIDQYVASNVLQYRYNLDDMLFSSRSRSSSSSSLLRNARNNRNGSSNRNQRARSKGRNKKKKAIAKKRSKSKPMTCY